MAERGLHYLPSVLFSLPSQSPQSSPTVTLWFQELLKSCQDHIQLVTLKQHEEMGSGGQANKEEPISHPGTPTDTLSVSVQ